MNSKLHLTTSVSALALAAGTLIGAQAPATANDDWYISLFAGASVQDGTNFQYYYDPYHLKSKTGFTFGGAAGTIIKPGLRGELEFSIQHQDAKQIEEDLQSGGGQNIFPASGSINSYFVLANIWKDFTLGRFTPYVGAGVGAGIVDFDVTYAGLGGPNQGLRDTTVGFAAQIGTGLKFPVTDRLSVDLAYRLKAVVTPFVKGSSSTAYNYHAFANVFSHSAQVGFTYALGETQHPVPASLDSSDAYGTYVSLFGGGAFQGVHSSNFSGENVYKLDTKDGFTVGGAVGTALAPGLRGEIEISYAENKLTGYTDLEGEPSSVHASNGTHGQLYFLANIWKSVNLGQVSPYVGAGIGFGLNILDGVYNTTGVGGTGNRRFDDSGLGLATQFGAGLTIAAMDNVSIDVGYRFKSIIGALIGGGTDDPTTTTFTNHIAQVGVNWALGPNTITPASDDSEQRPWYTSVFAGGAFTQNAGHNFYYYVYEARYKTGFTFGGTAGTEVLPGVRGELEASYLQYAVKDQDYGYAGSPRTPASGDVKSFFLLANLWKDFDLGGGIKPYIGAGIGMALVSADLSFGGFPLVDDVTVAPAGQLGAGLRYDVNRAITLDLGYRMKSVINATLEAGNGTGAPHSQYTWFTHVVQGGISFHM